VDHLDEVPGAVGPAVQVAVLRRRGLAGAPRRALRRANPRRQRGEDRIEPLDRSVGAADHQAVAALEAEDAAAGAAVDEVDAALAQLLGAADVVAVVGVAAVDDRVARLEHSGDVLDRLLGDLARRHHHPDRAGVRQRRCQVLQRGDALGALARHLRDRVGVDVVGDDAMPIRHQAARHVGPHASEADDSQLHQQLPLPAVRSGPMRLTLRDALG
jgi:hypothetical protein